MSVTPFRGGLSLEALRQRSGALADDGIHEEIHQWRSVDALTLRQALG